MILTVGLSSAWQRVLRLETLQLGEVNRAREVLGCAAGKSLNVARALGQLAAPHHAIAFAGGETGETLRRDLALRGIAHTLLPTATATRSCTTVCEVSSGRVTELVEEAAALAPAELEQLRAAFRARAPQARVIVLSGSLPAGCPPEIYGELLAEGGSAATIVDAHGPALLAALPRRPTFVKPNRQELAHTLGRELGTDEDLRRAMQELNRLGARWVVVSDGPRALWVSGKSGYYRCGLPPVPVVNPIGGGDALAAGIACGLQRGQRSLEAVRLGLAAALASVGTALPGELDPARVEALEAGLCLE